MPPLTAQASENGNAAAAVIDFILDKSAEEKIKELFNLFDEDGNGRIQRQELINVLGVCAHDIGLEVDEYLEEVADAVFNAASLTSTGDITLEGLEKVLKHRSHLFNELAIVTQKRGSYSEASRNEQRGRQRRSSADKWDMFIDKLTVYMPILKKLRRDYISNNYVIFSFITMMTIATFSLYCARVYTYWDNGVSVIIARASGQCLNFLCSLIILLVCRRSISFLRVKGFGRYLPVDEHIYIHKLIGWQVLFHSLVHTCGHVANFAVLAMQPDSKYTWYDYAFTTKLGIGWIHGTASISGWLLFAILALMTFTHLFARKYGKFELFYYTHLLYIPFLAILIVHAPHYWIWFCVPFFIFTIETSIKMKNLASYVFSEEETTIMRGIPLPSNVIQLVIKRPPDFDYQPGDWVYILIPKIAKYEWHPFTISSAPEQDGIITLHIRAVGEWTRSLFNFYEDITYRDHLKRFIKYGKFSMSQDRFSTTIDIHPSNDSQDLGHSSTSKPRYTLRRSPALPDIPEIELTTMNSKQSIYKSGSNDLVLPTHTNRSFYRKQELKVLIDGPYGSPSGQIFQCEHAILIATGIGVTPFASILQSIVHHNEKRRHKCPCCSTEFLDCRKPVVQRLRKVDFVWINRDQKSFEWFIKLLAELELTQSQLSPEERFLDIHIHLTAIEKSKIKSVAMQLALFLMHESNKKDLVTGLKTRTKPGRPDWDQFFGEIKEHRRGKVSVFFCGRPQLSRQLHGYCNKYGFRFMKEVF